MSVDVYLALRSWQGSSFLGSWVLILELLLYSLQEAVTPLLCCSWLWEGAQKYYFAQTEDAAYVQCAFSYLYIYNLSYVLYIFKYIYNMYHVSRLYHVLYKPMCMCENMYNIYVHLLCV